MRSVSTADVFDVVVVGAGLAGLTAANLLEQAGRSVLVVEASHQVGGRTRSQLLGGRAVDIGGELIGKHYTLTRRLVHDLGLHLDPANSRFPRIRLYGPVRGAPRPRSAASIVRVDRQIRKLIRDLDPSAPWTHPAAAELDATSTAQWLTTQAHHDVRPLLGTLARAFTSASPGDLSLLHFLLWLQPAGGLTAAYQETRWRVREGAQEISRRLARRLHRPILLNTPVHHISHCEDDLASVSSGVNAWRSRQVAVCVPLATTGAVEFNPVLPPRQRRLVTEVTAPPITKLLIAPTAAKRSILAVGDSVLPVASLSSHHGMSFAYGRHTREPSTTLIHRLHNVLQSPSSTMPSLAHAWHDEFHIAGGYPAFAPGQLSQLGPALRQSVGPIHFGGADRSTWPGTIEGALRDGHRLAHTLLTQPPL